jgi:hypothetical protein
MCIYLNLMNVTKYKKIKIKDPQRKLFKCIYDCADHF